MVASVILPYLDICLAVSSGHESKLRFWTALIQVVRMSDNLKSVVFIRYIIVIIFIVSIIKTNSSLSRSPISIYFVYKITNGMCSFLHIIPVPLQSLILSVPDYRSLSFFHPG